MSGVCVFVPDNDMYMVIWLKCKMMAICTCHVKFDGMANGYMKRDMKGHGYVNKLHYGIWLSSPDVYVAPSRYKSWGLLYLVYITNILLPNFNIFLRREKKASLKPKRMQNV